MNSNIFLIKKKGTNTLCNLCTPRWSGTHTHIRPLQSRKHVI